MSNPQRLVVELPRQSCPQVSLTHRRPPTSGTQRLRGAQRHVRQPMAAVTGHPLSSESGRDSRQHCPSRRSQIGLRQRVQGQQSRTARLTESARGRDDDQRAAPKFVSRRGTRLRECPRDVLVSRAAMAGRRGRGEWNLTWDRRDRVIKTRLTARYFAWQSGLLLV